MSKTNSGDEQTQSRQAGVRRKQRADQYQPDSDRTTATGRARNHTRNQPQRTDRTVCTGDDSSGGAIAGGILRQLIAKSDSQLAKIKNRLNQLETERQTLEQEQQDAILEREQLQALLENLQQMGQDNP